MKKPPRARSKVFISYRRDDTAGYARLLYDRLSRRLPGLLFADREGIRPGDDYMVVLRRELENCEVLIALISKQWLTITDAEGKRRLDDPKDWVRIEIKTALERNIRVVPALLAGARMPNRDELPEDIAELASRQALEISDTDIDGAVERLKPVLPQAHRPRWKWIAAALLLAVAGVGAWAIGKSRPSDSGLDAFRRARTGQQVAPAVEASIGITLWRCPSASGEVSGQSDCAPVRVAAKSPLRTGDRVRITVESPRAGYLYVIDREQYADGRTGEPWLLFPTLRTKGGENRIRAGELIQIPSPTDPRLQITLRPGPGSTGDLLLFLVTPKPLDNIQLDLAPIKLPGELVERWKREWQTTVKQVEFSEGSGQPPSEAEKAAIGGQRKLSFEDRAPQTIYYVKAKPAAPLLVEVPLAVNPR